MASPVASPPVPATPPSVSPSATPPPSSTRPPAPPRDTCIMILSWLRSAVPSILAAAGHSRRSRSDDPASALAATLADGVVLADLVAYLDPNRLQSVHVIRASPRNALSVPAPAPGGSRNIDARQLAVQYRSNTRRAVAAVKKILDDVRKYSRYPHRPPPGAVDSFVADVASVPPSTNLRPAARLAELVIATAVYGPRHNEFRHSIWRFPSEAAQTAFHAAMSAVAEAVALPPPDVLYASGPTPPHPGSPVARGSPPPHPSDIFSPPAHPYTARPPTAPTGHSPAALSPRASFIPQPVIGPHVMSPPMHALPASSAPFAAISPPMGFVPSPHAAYPLSPPVMLTPYSAPPPAQRSSGTHSPAGKMQSPGKAGTPPHPHVLSPRHAPVALRPVGVPPRGSTSRGSAGSPRGSTSSRASGQSSRHSKPPLPGRNDVVSLQRPKAPDAGVMPLVDGVMRRNPHEEGMGGRKFSMVTEESQSTSPTRADHSARIAPVDTPRGGSLADLHLRTTAGSGAAQGAFQQASDNSEIVQSMRSLEREHRMRRKGPSSSRSDEATGETTDHSGSKRSSEEFFTPREQSPSPIHRVERLVPHPPPREEPPSFPTPSEEYLPSPPITGTYPDISGTGMKDTKVDETVRQSVTSSIAEQISRPPMFMTPTDHRASGERRSAAIAPPLFRPESTTSSLDFRDPSFLYSPSASDAPSPSNQWQIACQKVGAEDILSPLPLFSPPPMPPRQSRVASSTQMTPSPRPAPPLFRPGPDSPQLSVSSAGRSSVPPSGQPQDQKIKTRVSFAPTITSPGGRPRPLGQPLRTADQESERAPTSKDSTASFQLPPCAASSSQDVADPQQRHEEVSASESRESSSFTAGHTDEMEDEQGDDSQDEELSDYEDDEGRITANDSFLERQTFEQVEEVVVRYSDDERENPNSGRTQYTPEREGAVQQETHDDDDVGEYDDPEDDDEEMDDMGRDFLHDDEDHDDDEDHMDVADVGTLAENEPTTVIEDEDEDEASPVEQPEPTRNSHTQESDPGHILKPSIPRPSSQGSSTFPVRSSHQFSTPNIGVPRSREVPPTPPSPPDITRLVRTISDSRRTSAKNELGDDDDDDDGPVSTMAPSDGLFQKLISLWQSADEAPMPDEGGMTEGPPAQHFSGADSSHFAGADVSPFAGAAASQTSTHESTLRSGDTEGFHEKLPASVGESSAGESSRNRRPRAIRMPHGSSTPLGLRSPMVPSEKRTDLEEKASVASFSDAFSSDDKDRVWADNGRTNLGGEWEEAMKGDNRAGFPLSPPPDADKPGQQDRTSSANSDARVRPSPPQRSPPAPRRFKSHSVGGHIVIGRNGVMTDGRHVRVDKRRLDWLTRELLAARDAISRKELQMTFAETQRMEQEEILLLERQDAESVVDAMKTILAERENELHTARSRLSMAIQSGPSGQERASVESRSSNATGGQDLGKLIIEGNEKLQKRLEACDKKHADGAQAITSEMRALWAEVQRAMSEKMSEMNEKRDDELDVLRGELMNRERLINELQQSSTDLVDQNRAIQSEAAELRLQKEKTAHRYELEMSHVSAQVELVNEFSKKLHDNFRETENLRQQVLQYQDKLSHITSTSGVSQRQIKELREAVTRANDECARLRREAELAKKKGMEAVRRAEELEELRYKDAAAPTTPGRYPDRQDSGSFRSHEPVRPAGQNRPGGTGVNARYHGANRARGGGTTPAHKAWLVLKERIGGIVTGKDSGSSRRRGVGGAHTGTRELSRVDSESQSSRSATRSRVSRDEDVMPHTRSGSRSTAGGSGSSGRSGTGRSGRSGDGRSGDGRSGDGRSAGGSGGGSNAYMHQVPYAKGEVGRIRATDF